MNFESDDIKGSVEFVRMENVNESNTKARFLIKTDKPSVFQRYVFTSVVFSDKDEVLFRHDDLYNNIVSKFPEVIEYMSNTHLNEVKRLENEAKEDPKKWFFSGFGIGFYIYPEDERQVKFRDDLRKVKELLEINHVNNDAKILKELKENSVRVEVKNFPGRFEHEISHEKVMEIYNNLVTRIERIEYEEMQKEIRRIDSVFEIAKKTGEKQIIERYTVPCPDHKEECNTDIVTVWAMPDGSKTTTQNHTW